ncbi:hypothetical protein [Flavobacterium poyangense]|uniref:hypothetical protein n=1 Tax=Flavobacterium poyangense TaxID=2204302 RepID=UPI001423F8A8|nr:hypothetical protein [Flavobacterium sp. JXAS1]
MNLLFANLVFSQECNYKKYNELVTLAKKENAVENFKEANTLFKLAFENTDFVFGTDLNIALKVADKTGDKIWMKQIAIKLAKGGIPLVFFKKFENHKWYKQFFENFPEYQEYYTSNFDSNLKTDLIDLEKFDKEINNHYHQWRTKEHDYSIDTLVSEMKTVSIRFQNIVEKYGFPTERKFGYYYTKKSIEELPTSIVLIHIYQRGELLYKDQLNELVCNGSLTPIFAEQLQNTKGFGNSTGIEQEMEVRKLKYRK